MLEDPQLCHYVFAIIGTPIGLGLIVRQIVSFKTITFGKKKITIDFLLKRKDIVFSVKEVITWKEEVIKTMSGTYKETEIQLPRNIVLKISKQEYTNYDKAFNYLTKHCSKAKQA